MPDDDQPLSRRQLDVLELESRRWRLEGSKISEFRRRHPGVTETGYYVILGRLLTDRRAYEYGGRRYAPMLTRIAQTASEAEIRRGTFRTQGDQPWAESSSPT